jgi:hypothetical protein
MILTVHIQGAPSYDIGDEIWQQSLADAIPAPKPKPSPATPDPNSSHCPTRRIAMRCENRSSST